MFLGTVSNRSCRLLERLCDACETARVQHTRFGRRLSALEGNFAARLRTRENQTLDNKSAQVVGEFVTLLLSEAHAGATFGYLFK